MSQHNITGSEVFGAKPFVIMRGVKTGAFRRKRAARGWLAFTAGAVVAAGAASAAYAEAVDSYMSRYDTLLGDTSSDGDIASLTSNLATQLTSLAGGTGDRLRLQRQHR